MKEEEASLMIIRNAVASLAEDQQQRVNGCVSAIRDVMGQYDAEDAGIALMLIAAEVAAE
ncbi:hypothetical protein N5923_21630 [Erwiniaceae bacterium BAC15a-03b]|uniref:Uncharacterized protein n=1 Tax=Winslowiella arboricola TaxID=2978220 RepID=A0A9J6PX82_9GAMM|nr:hypothetical protein [Winslowiella arboricola]MCU5774752.1 hypothetical protein [Winslowiella arboricola]MCU5780096.1 hypothetical protein [Winslowiella arboricola]